MSKIYKLLCNAQFFGYAPTSELLMVVKRLVKNHSINKVQIAIIDNGMIFDLFDINKKSVDIIPNEGKVVDKYLSDSDLYREYDIMYSSYDPYLILYGWFYNKITVFYDGLFFLWEFDKNELIQTYSKLIKYKIEQNFEAFWNLFCEYSQKNYHASVILTHFVSTLNVVRRDNSEKLRFKQLPFLKNKVIPIGAIVNKITLGSYSKKKHILVSLSGSLTPTLTIKQNVHYAKHVFEYIRYLKSILEDYDFTMICNPIIYENISKHIDKFPEIKVITSVPIEKFQELIAVSKIVMIPPALSSIEVVAYQKTPVFFIPEQHGSQSIGIPLLKEIGYPVDFGLTLTHDIYDDKSKFNDIDTEIISKEVLSLLTEEKYRVIREKKAHILVETIKDKRKYGVIMSAQYNAIKHKVNDFNGADNIREIICKIASSSEVVGNYNSQNII